MKDFIAMVLFPMLCGWSFATWQKSVRPIEFQEIKDRGVKCDGLLEKSLTMFESGPWYVGCERKPDYIPFGEHDDEDDDTQSVSKKTPL